MTEPAPTEGAGRLLATAREEAERLGHAQIGTEHLLLALLRERDSLPADAAALLPKDPDNAAKRLMGAGKRGRRPRRGWRSRAARGGFSTRPPPKPAGRVWRPSPPSCC